MNRSHNAIVVLVALIAFAIGLYFYNQQSAKTFSENTYVYEPARALSPFKLQDEQGKVFTNAELSGKWSFVFLGYLSCPDICPMTMAKFSRLIPKMEVEVEEPTQILFLSVDPKRDSHTKIAKYTDYFHDNIVGLRAEHVDLFPFVRNLGLMYSIPGEEEKTGYYVDHSASIVLLNPEGQIAAIFKPEVVLNQVPTVNMDTLLTDFQTIVR